MRFEPRLDPPTRARPLAHRLGWLALYWLASISVLGAVAWVLRLWIAP